MKGLAIRSVVVAVLACAPVAYAAELAGWTFEVSGPNLILNDSASSPVATAEEGVFASTSLAWGQHASSATDWSSPAGNGSVESFSVNTWAIGDYWEFETSTSGYTDITLTWDQTRSSTGPGTFNLQYSTDGTTFVDLVTDYTVLENSANNGGFWNSTTRVPNYQLGPIAVPGDLNNLPTVYFRLTCMVTPGGAGGTNRVDNVFVAGIPEPACWLLLGLGALGLLRRR
jgi:hypothetical protein